MNDEFLSLEDILDIMQEVVIQFLIPHFLELGMEASGNWREQLNVGADPNIGYIQGTKYTEQLVYGRRPGTMPPVEPLVKWAQIKWGLPLEEAKKAAWGIAVNMKEYGNYWYRQGGSSLLEVLQSQPVIDFINQRQKNYIEKQIEIELNRYLTIKFR